MLNVIIRHCNPDYQTVSVFSLSNLNESVACSGAARCCECEGRCCGELCDTNREREEYQRGKRSQVNVITENLVCRDTESKNTFKHTLVLTLLSKSIMVLTNIDACLITLTVLIIDNCRFKVNLHQCLIQISGYNVLFVTVEELRKDVFDSENEVHEKMLLKVSDLRLILIFIQICYCRIFTLLLC